MSLLRLFWAMQNAGFNLLFAGHDTSASTLACLLLFLKQQPRTLQKLRDEQSQVRSGANSDLKQHVPSVLLTAERKEQHRVYCILHKHPQLSNASVLFLMNCV